MPMTLADFDTRLADIMKTHGKGTGALIIRNETPELICALAATAMICGVPKTMLYTGHSYSHIRDALIHELGVDASVDFTNKIWTINDSEGFDKAIDFIRAALKERDNVNRS